MEDLSLCRIAALVPEFAVKDLPLGRKLMMVMMMMMMMINVVSGKIITREGKNACRIVGSGVSLLVVARNECCPSSIMYP